MKSVVIALLAACGSRPAPAPAIELRFGDCASVDTPFVVGPRPQPLTPLPDPPLAMLPEPPPASVTSFTKRNPYVDPDAKPRALSVPQLWWVMRKQSAALASCWSERREQTTSLAGTLELSFTITPSGTVLRAKAVGLDEDVATCVTTIVAKLRFPREPDAGPQPVTYPLRFTGRADSDPTDPNPPPPERPVDRSYVAGVSSPLAPLTPDLIACLQGTSGAGVIDIDGMTLRAHGESPEIAQCIEKLGGKVRSSTPRRCSYAWSRTPGGGLVRVDVSRGGASTGVPVRSRSTTDPVTRIGPTVITAAADVPMTDVNKVLRTLRKGGFDTVFAQRTNDALVPTGELAHPLVPVPVDTGLRWDHLKQPTLRVQVRRAGTYVLLPTAEGELVSDGVLAATLRTHRGTFTDLEIGALDVDAARVFTVIAAATAVGFDYVVVPYEDL